MPGRVGGFWWTVLAGECGGEFDMGRVGRDWIGEGWVRRDVEGLEPRISRMDTNGLGREGLGGVVGIGVWRSPRRWPGRG